MNLKLFFAFVLFISLFNGHNGNPVGDKKVDASNLDENEYDEYLDEKLQIYVPLETKKLSLAEWIRRIGVQS